MSSANQEAPAGKEDRTLLKADPVHWDELLSESIALLAPEFVRSAYRSLLGREPDQEGFDAYIRLLTTRRDFSCVLDCFVRSEEFRRPQRFTEPNPAESYEDPTLVFLHIQKTGGTSVQNHLRDCFGSEKLYREHDDSLYLRSPSELSKYSVFAGHFNYDSLRYIPRRSLSVFTFVREPKVRLCSAYSFWRAHEPSHPSYDMILEPRANRLPIEDFFEDPVARRDPAVWNHMCRAIMGERKWRQWASILTAEKVPGTQECIIEEVMRPAIVQRLEEFAFVGLQEDFSRSVEILFHNLRKEMPAKIRVDNSLESLMEAEPHFKKKMKNQPVTPRLIAALNSLTQLDNIVYDEAKRLYARHGTL